MSQENRLRFLLLISGMVCFGWVKAVNADQLSHTNKASSPLICEQVTSSIQIKEVVLQSN